jgi:hypothetical protein
VIVEVFILKIGWVGGLLPDVFSKIILHHCRTFSMFSRIRSSLFCNPSRFHNYRIFLPTGLYTHPSYDMTISTIYHRLGLYRFLFTLHLYSTLCRIAYFVYYMTPRCFLFLFFSISSYMIPPFPGSSMISTLDEFLIQCVTSTSISNVKVKVDGLPSIRY